MARRGRCIQGGSARAALLAMAHSSGFYGMRAFLILCAASACHVSPRLGSPRTPLRGAPLALRDPPCRVNPAGQPHKKLAPGPWGAACAGGGPPAPSGALRLQRMAQDRLASLEGGAQDFYFHGITPLARSLSVRDPQVCAKKPGAHPARTSRRRPLKGGHPPGRQREKLAGGRPCRPPPPPPPPPPRPPPPPPTQPPPPPPPPPFTPPS